MLTAERLKFGAARAMGDALLPSALSGEFDVTAHDLDAGLLEGVA